MPGRMLLSPRSQQRIALLHPRLPVQLREEDFDGALLLPWLDAHTATVAALAASTGAGLGMAACLPLPPICCCRPCALLPAQHGTPAQQSAWSPVTSAQLGLPLLPSMFADRRELLTAAADGSLALTPLTAEDNGSSSRLYESGGAVTFSVARWNGPHTAVTGSLQGGRAVGRNGLAES